MVWFAYKTDVPLGWAVHTVMAGSTQISKELGSYKIQHDTKAPVITPINQQTWVSKQNFIFRLSDNLSGVQTYRGEIDGQFVLFEMNNKSVITYRFDKERLQRGKHELKLIVTDACGNESIYTHPFTW